MKKEIDLNALQKEAEKLLLLLNDRHPDLMTWNTFLYERIENIRKLVNE